MATGARATIVPTDVPMEREMKQEAMNMQNEIMAPADGTVSDVRASAGQTVATGDVMIVL